MTLSTLSLILPHENCERAGREASVKFSLPRRTFFAGILSARAFADNPPWWSPSPSSSAPQRWHPYHAAAPPTWWRSPTPGVWRSSCEWSSPSWSWPCSCSGSRGASSCRCWADLERVNKKIEMKIFFVHILQYCFLKRVNFEPIQVLGWRQYPVLVFPSSGVFCFGSTI